MKRIILISAIILSCLVCLPVINTSAKTSTDGLIVENGFTYAVGTHSATGSGKWSTNGVTHRYNYSGVTYQYYNVYLSNDKKTAYASLRAKASSDSSYLTDSSRIKY